MDCKTIKKIEALRSRVIPRGHASGTTCYVDSAKGAVITDPVSYKKIRDRGV